MNNRTVPAPAGKLGYQEKNNYPFSEMSCYKDSLLIWFTLLSVATWFTYFFLWLEFSNMFYVYSAEILIADDGDCWSTSALSLRFSLLEDQLVSSKPMRPDLIFTGILNQFPLVMELWSLQYDGCSLDVLITELALMFLGCVVCSQLGGNKLS